MHLGLSTAPHLALGSGLSLVLQQHPIAPLPVRTSGAWPTLQRGFRAQSALAHSGIRLLLGGGPHEAQIVTIALGQRGSDANHQSPGLNLRGPF